MIYVDKLVAWPSGVWCHLLTDGPLNELHAFAKKIGLKREWFQPGSTPHYDLKPSKRVMAVKEGAIEADTYKVVEIIRAWRAKSPTQKP